VYYVEKPDSKQSYVRIGHLGGLVSDEDYADRIVMNSILGGGFGSRVTNSVRTKLGLAYSAGGRYISNFAYPGYFFMVASTKPQSTIKAAREIIKQIKSMQTDLPTEEEMLKGKDGYLNSFVFNFDTRREVVGRMMTYDFYDMPKDFLQIEKQRVEEVTPEAVMTAAKSNLRTDQMIVLVVGNAADFDEPLKALGLGPIDTIDITIPSGEAESKLSITPENLEKGNDILHKAVEAHGGLDNFKKITSIEYKGTLTLIMNGQELPVSIQSLKVFPDRSRDIMNFMGNKIFTIRNGDSGWKTDQKTMKLVEMTQKDIDEDDIDITRNIINIFSRYDDPYYRVVYNGSGNINETDVEWLVLIDSSDEPICQLGINSETFEYTCQKYWGKSAMGEGSLEKVYLHFKEYNGVKLPVNSVVSMNGQKIMTSDISERTINGEIPANAFTKP
ncbi:MAG: insulinase family protein, partial [candidate division Zixibacteria bacterium]|nr:insulinase family protein [candidate division Zixibacteria bacterium]